jgi:hypothetical protein
MAWAIVISTIVVTPRGVGDQVYTGALWRLAPTAAVTSPRLEGNGRTNVLCRHSTVEWPIPAAVGD